MLLQAFKDIIVPKYNKYIVYIHNIGNFDGIILLKKLLSKYEIKPLIRDNSLLAIDVSKLNKPKIKIRLLDSINLLNDNLRNLGKSFEVNIQKGVFPYDFVNKFNLDYVGSNPHYEYYKFDKKYFNFNDYCILVKSVWSMKDETFLYLKMI